MNLQALVFDFDGVLADSVEVKTDAFARLFAPFGDEIVSKVVVHHRENGGMSRYEKFRIYYERYLGKTYTRDIAISFGRQFEQMVVDAVVAAPEIRGVSFFIEKYTHRLPCFINSATPDAELKKIVAQRGWSAYFKEILGAPATKTENLTSLIERYELRAQQVLFFGDAVSDYRAAVDTEAQFFGISKDADSPLLRYAPQIIWAQDFYEVDALLTRKAKL